MYHSTIVWIFKAEPFISPDIKQNRDESLPFGNSIVLYRMVEILID